MAKSMRAKVHVTSTTKYSDTQESVAMSPVCSSPFGPNGESEDNTFARYTPSGSISLMITNPELIGSFKAGDTFYVDFTPVVRESVPSTAEGAESL